MKIDLIDQVIEQIKKDIDVNDYTAIYELLEKLPVKDLYSFLSEVE